MHLLKPLFLLLLMFLSLLVSAQAEDYNVNVRYLHVQKGQTLHNIIRRLYPDQKKQWPSLSAEIVRLNPHAFINNDPERMKADVQLRLPGNTRATVKAKPYKAKQVGEVAEVSGSVIAVDKRKVSRKLHNGNAVYLGDKVITGEDGSVRLHMVDDAILDLRCYSIMVIEDYALNTTSRRSILNLLQGSLRKVTGKIGKMSEDVYELKTPLASVGVRGTEYALRVYQSKGCGGTIDADDGMYLEVIKGLVDVHNKSGNAVVMKGETAYVALPDSVPEKTPLKAGIISPQKPVQQAVASDEESNSGWWWLLLGAVGIALLI
jgi:hypothetical protein